MNSKRIVITGVVLSIIYILMDYLVHGVLLKDIYIQTSSIWRPQTEMQQLCWMMLLGEIIFAFVFAVIFSKGYELGKNGVGQGLRFGWWMGLLLGPTMGLLWYVILPIPGMLAVYWSVAMFVEMVVLGIIAGITYNKV